MTTPSHSIGPELALVTLRLAAAMVVITVVFPLLLALAGAAGR